MDFKELEYFSTIVKCGNLTHAARQLYVSQPTLSKFLQKLEEDLGLVLFQRGSRRLKLTYAGQRYYAHVERILSQKREMDAEMTDILRSDRGVLYVGIPPFRCSFSLPKVLPIFHKEFPQVQFRIVEAPSAVLDQKLLNGEIDLAFYMSFERITGLSYQVMHSDKMYAILSKGHPLEAKAAQIGEFSLEWLAGQTLLLQNRTQRQGQYILQELEKRHIQPAEILESSNIRAAAALAANGYGVGFLSGELLEHLELNIPFGAYKCNMHCTYCYQQNDKTLEKKLISDETLDKILSIIAQYMEANPNKTVRLGLFGGEPLLIENEKVIDKILQFCKEHKTTVHITTNGSFLSYYLKKFIINRRFISGIYPTIDSMALNYMTRYDLDPSRNNTNETFKLLCCIKTLLHYGIHVDLGTNIDRHNHKEIWNTLDDLKKLQLLQDKNFAWTIGRVDDRLYETNFPDIMMESEILAELQSKPLPDNVHAAFLKTCYNFADKMGLKLNLREHKQTHSYCWSTSSSSNVFYVDMNLKTYRCTCTVGRSRYSLFDFSYENLTNYRPVAVTCNSYAECKDCKIGGFCGGGCQLSHQIDFKKCCTYEEEVFSHFMKTLFIPYIKSKYNEVNQNERKAENRCT